MQPHKTYFNWSTGKDSAMALRRMLQDDRYQVSKLLTTVNAAHDRVSMHGLPRELMEAQVEAIGIPSMTIELPEQPSMEQYGELMRSAVEELKDHGYTHCGFGDIFLEDLRAYREKQLGELGMKAVFPIWKEDTKRLIYKFIQRGFKAIVICASDEKLGEEFVGRELDEEFIADLPEDVDPCGENGEFHTFCYDGPIFKHPVHFEVGEKVLRTYPAPDGNEGEIGFWFCDLALKVD